MRDQRADVRLYASFVAWMRNNEWALRTPLRHAERLFHSSSHRMVDRASFLDDVLRLVGRTASRPLAVYEQELVSDGALLRCYLSAIERKLIRQKYPRFEDAIRHREANVVAYYALFRELKPQVVVETGTAAGAMTSWILAALHANGDGRLISIDLPPVAGQRMMERTLSESDLGVLIPDEYRDRWTYIAGDAKVVLPRVLADHSVDVFVHDSLHTRTHMQFEYLTARSLMKPGTLLVSDDILSNGAYFDFVRSHQLPSISCIANPNLGIALNRFDEFELGIGTAVVTGNS